MFSGNEKQTYLTVAGTGTYINVLCLGKGELLPIHENLNSFSLTLRMLRPQWNYPPTTHTPPIHITMTPIIWLFHKTEGWIFAAEGFHIWLWQTAKTILKNLFLSRGRHSMLWPRATPLFYWLQMVTICQDHIYLDSKCPICDFIELCPMVITSCDGHWPSKISLWLRGCYELRP